MMFSVPPGYQRTADIKRPKLDGFTGFIDQWLQDDLNRPRKQRHTAKRIFERLRDERQFRGGYTTVKNYVRDHGRRSREMFVQVLRLLETFGMANLNVAIKHLVLCQVEKRPSKLDLDVYPYLPKANVGTTSAASYMSLMKRGKAA